MVAPIHVVVNPGSAVQGIEFDVCCHGIRTAINRSRGRIIAVVVQNEFVCFRGPFGIQVNGTHIVHPINIKIGCVDIIRKIRLLRTIHVLEKASKGVTRKCQKVG